MGSPTSVETAASDLFALVRWFLATGGAASGRAARHGAPLPMAAEMAPAPSRALSQVLASASGPFHAVPFGQIDADGLLALTRKRNVAALDRQSALSGKRVSVRVDIVVTRNIKKKK